MSNRNCFEMLVKMIAAFSKSPMANGKASTSATATGSTTGIDAKTGIAAYTAFATEFA